MFDADLWLYSAVVYTFAEQEKDPSSVLKDDRLHQKVIRSRPKVTSVVTPYVKEAAEFS